MRLLRYTASAFFFIVMCFLAYLAYENIKPYVPIIVWVIITVSLAGFIIMMGAVSISIWRAFSVSGEVERLRAKVVKRVPRNKG